MTIYCRATEFNDRILDVEPGGVIDVSGDTLEGLYIPKRVRGMADKHITIVFNDVHALADLDDHALTLSGAGDQAYIDFKGTLSLEGGSVSLYNGPSAVNFEECDLFLIKPKGDGVKLIGSMVDTYPDPLPWWGEDVRFGLVDVTGAGEECFDNTGMRKVSVKHLRLHDGCSRNGVITKNLSQMNIDLMEVSNYVYAESVLVLGGLCDNSRGKRYEAYDSVVNRLVLNNVQAKRGIAWMSARNCHVENVTATNCTWSIGAVVAGEGLNHFNQTQQPSLGCSVNSIAWFETDKVWAEFPPPPVVVEEPDPIEELKRQIGTLSAKCEANKQLLDAHRERLDHHGRRLDAHVNSLVALEKPHKHDFAVTSTITSTTGPNMPVEGGE